MINKDPQSELGKLQYKFFYSGIDNSPIISDKELNALRSQLVELSVYFRDRGDNTIAFALARESNSVQNIIWARSVKS